ncbi:MAG: amino acid adenylation domain-containing protein, partial [Acidobacteria bacterium]|nr:amino acid adenylation domain-containing protein [Acidobacteriota bacterium]
LETLYGQYKRGEKPALPPKTDSFKLWSERLSEYANSKTFLKEKTYWQKIESLTVPLLPKDFDVADNYIKNVRSISFTLSEKETSLLLRKVNRAYKTEINDILLTALGLGIKKSFALDHVLIALEGHGREEIFEGIDISRTVGWFTSVYPIVIDIGQTGDLGRLIKETKETFRRIPNKGIGYGILKYLTSDENKKNIQFKLKPQISFNYLGQFDADVKQLSFFEPAKESSGHSQGLDNHREYLLDVSGMIADNRLTMTVLYNENHFKSTTAAAMINVFETELIGLIDFCCSRDIIEPTPGDFSCKELTIETVDRLVKEYPGLDDIYNLTPMQEGILFHALMNEKSYSYFEQTSYCLQGKLDIALVEKSLNELYKRHDILRTAFVYKDIDHPVQVVLKERVIDFYYENISKIGMNDEKENFIKEFQEKDKKRLFDLSKEGMRVSILQVAESGYEFIWSFHHILMDGWCCGILNKEFFEIYASYLENRPYRLPEVTPYRMYIQWLQKQDKEESERYWENYLDSYEEQTGIPRTKISKKENIYRNQVVSTSFDMEKTTRLNKLAALNHVTLNTVIQTLWGILLGKYNDKEDVVFGAVVSGRPSVLEGVESMIGLFINTIPVRVCFAGDLKFNELLKQIQEEALAGEPYHYHPLAEIQSRTLLKQNLIDHILAFENYPVAEQIEGFGKENNKSTKAFLKISNVELFEQTNYNFNIVLAAAEQLIITFQYNGDVYVEEDMKRIAEHFHLAIDQVIQNQEMKISQLTLLSEEEKNSILYEFNNTTVEYPRDKTIHQLFEEQVKKSPDYIALHGCTIAWMHDCMDAWMDGEVARNVSLTYRQLNEQSDCLAGLLIEKGVQPDNIVGIKIERSVEMIIGIFGILKSGGAYLPIDPVYPQERIDYMLKDSGTRILITNNENKKTNNCQCSIVNCQLSTWEPRASVDHASCPGQLAYIIYTSGTTGKPKSAGIYHRSFFNLIHWFVLAFGLTSEDRNILLTSLSFDLTQKNIFAPLVTGGELILYPSGYFDPDSILKSIEKKWLTWLNCTPSMAYKIVEYSSHEKLKRFASLRSLRYMFLGGEPISIKGFVQWVGSAYFKAHIINTYGPTECTDICAYYSLEEPLRFYEKNVPIGKPIYNAKLYVLDQWLQPMPIGAIGELFIGGEGIGLGYLNRPELTHKKFKIINYKLKIINRSGTLRAHLNAFGDEEKFHQSPFTTHQSPIYKTGDLCKWLLDGNIEFIGRIDQQVKIRGFRIELGEIESQLIKHPDIKEAAVVLVQGEDRDDKYLCAYFVSERAWEIRGLREYMAKELPDYMIPSYFVPLEKIPLTIHGKVDRNALPDPREHSLKDNADYMPPQNAIEKKLVEIWENVLGRSNVSTNENFFMTGGDSIKAIQIISRMNSAGYKLEMRDLFQYPIIADLSPRIKKLQHKPEQRVITGTFPLTPIQEMFFEQSYTDSHHYNQAVMFYAKERLAKEEIKAVFRKIQEHHDALRMTYEINKENGQVLQINHGLDYPLSLEEFEINDSTDLVTIAESIQASIDLEKGPLMKLGLFHLSDGDRLLIVIHHLVIDGVSWRILFEDIETLYNQMKQGKELTLPPKTDSFKTWAEKLTTYANSKEFLKEKTYWQKIESLKVPLIVKDFDLADNYVKDTTSISFSLGQEETELLLTRVNMAFGTEINDILITALAMSIKRTFGHEQIAITLEGHGREEIIEEIDISRTVGWFTSLYPVLADISYADDPARQIKEIKEILRRIPNKGIGCGILKYLTSEEHKKEIEFKLRPQISFNYLGQFDADVKKLSFFEPAKESYGHSQGVNNKQEYLLDVIGMTVNNRLTMTISYNKTHFKRETMAGLNSNFQYELQCLIAFCAGREKRESTPSDFTYKGLSIEGFNRIMGLYPDVEDIYTLTPMQEGMLYHAIADESSYSYFEQISYHLQGELDIYLVEKSLHELFKRHAILRTAFVYEDIERPVQLVLKDRTCDFYYQDISHIKERKDKRNFIKEFKEKDIARSFILSKDVLMRVSIFKLENAEYEFTWSHHHILMDGWCVGILNTEFFEIYSAFTANRPHKLQEIKPYRTYIQWLEKQDKEESRCYWENYLACYEEHSGIPVSKTKSKEENHYQNESVSLSLDIEKTSRLNELAAGNHVTVNTLMQGLWGILLGKYNGKEDVVFGAVVSGRPSELPGVESMIGLFINAIPVRICFAGNMKFNELLGQIQQEALAGEPYHYHPLAEIQSRTSLKKDLIDHIMIFENYPIAGQIQDVGKRTKTFLKLANVETFEQTNYNFNVIISGSAQLKISLSYNGNVYEQDFVEQISKHLILCFEQVIKNQELEIKDISLVSEEEKGRILDEFNNAAVEYPKDKTIDQLFIEQVLKTPDYIALHGCMIAWMHGCMDAAMHDCMDAWMHGEVARNVSLTYHELNEQSDRLAGLLIEKGVLPDSIVGIMMERSVEMIIGILGILKSGGAYLPIDPDFPQERIDYMLKDSNAKMMVRSLEELESGRAEKASSLPCFLAANSSNLAYVIYTSGSTGKPKGVLTTHANVTRVVRDCNYIEIVPGDRLLQLSNYAFDGSVFDIYGALLNGAALVMINKKDILEIERFSRKIKREAITVFFVTTALFNTLTEMAINCFDRVRKILFGGERVSVEHAGKALEYLGKDKIIHVYGPTETTVYATYYFIDFIEAAAGNIPIGKPISNTTAYIFDKNLKPVPMGINGEIFIGGDGVARGYLNSPELTAEKFIF